MASDDLIIAQITDTHIGTVAADRRDPNLVRLDRVLDHLSRMARRPDLLLVTGDLADPDDEAPYHILRDRLERCPFPFFACVGNHDSRRSARAVFGGGDADFYHYAVDLGALRLVVLDTLQEGRHGGSFCETRAEWLRATLNEAPGQPTLIVLHHPPIDTGIDWVTTAPAEPWLARLDAALEGQQQVIALVAGHVHRPIAATRNGIPVRVCPSVAPPLALDLAPLTPTAPDERPLVVDGPPGFALHLWRGGMLTTHVDFVQEHKVMLRFDRRMQAQIRGMFAERP